MNTKCSYNFINMNYVETVELVLILANAILTCLAAKVFAENSP